MSYAPTVCAWPLPRKRGRRSVDAARDPPSRVGEELLAAVHDDRPTRRRTGVDERDVVDVGSVPLEAAGCAADQALRRRGARVAKRDRRRPAEAGAAEAQAAHLAIEAVLHRAQAPALRQ